jgi:serine protease AprX
MRLDQERTGEDRSSALWTKGGREKTADSERGNVRSSALWGKGGRGFVALLALLVALMVPAAGTAHNRGEISAYVPSSLLAEAEANPDNLFRVIVQGTRGNSSAKIAERVLNENGKLKRKFLSISGVAVVLSGKNLLKVAHDSHVFAITRDVRVAGAQEATSDPLASTTSDPLATSSTDTSTSSTDTSTSSTDTSTTSTDTSTSSTDTSTSSTDTSTSSTDTSTSSTESTVVTEPAPSPSYAPPPANSEMWRESVHADMLWSAIDLLTGAALESAPQAPAIAIVDSGVDPSNLADFGGRIVASVNLSSLSPGATGDDQGHGTMVAGIAAGANPSHAGAAPNAPIVSIRTSDAQGQSLTSDVIAAADWILANKNAYGIRVANFSLAGSVQTSFRFDPLDKAVERLWFAGVVVVAAAGNHGTEDGAQVSMAYAPGNDPFIITVGALDQAQTADPYDDSVPWWSGKGYTMDGFYKPDMAAPGRYMVGPVPTNGTMPATAPERLVEAGYMWMSGTSFAAPVVSGLAAQLLARHPDWGPDEVKGALMLTSAYLGVEGSGVGAVDGFYAALLDFTPPNPNEGFYPFVEADPVTGQPFFNEANWANYVATEANWAQANWAAAAWASANWAQANWAQAAWSSANWAQSVESSMTTTASWNVSANAE